jgi:hypothetical protein
MKNLLPQNWGLGGDLQNNYLRLPFNPVNADRAFASCLLITLPRLPCHLTDVDQHRIIIALCSPEEVADVAEGLP